MNPAMNDVCSSSLRPEGQEPGSLQPQSNLGGVDYGFVCSLRERLRLLEQLRAMSGAHSGQSHIPASVRMWLGLGPRPIISSAGVPQQSMPAGFRLENGTQTRDMNGVQVVSCLPAHAIFALRDLLMKDCMARIDRSCDAVAQHLSDNKGKEDANEEEASGDDGSCGGGKRSSKCVRIKCRYCGQISNGTELTVYRNEYDPHTPRHRSCSKKDLQLPGIPVGLSERSGRCFFCYAPFPQAPLAVPRQDTDFDTYLSWEYNPRALKYRKRKIDSTESNLRYRVLMHNTGLLPYIEGKISDKIPKQISDLVSDNESL